MKVGVVVWAEGTTVKFRILEDVTVERGDILKVEGHAVKHIIKVVDFKPETLLTPIEIARLSLKKARGEEVELYDGPLRYYDTAIATIVAEITRDGDVRRPTSVPKLFTDVYTLEEDEIEELNLDTGDIELGFVRMGSKVTTCRVSISGAKAFPHHMLICSITGGGKTNLGKVIAWNIMRLRDRRYSMVIVDTEGEYFDGGDSHHLGLVHSPSSEEGLFFVSYRVKDKGRITYRFRYNGALIERRIRACPLRISISSLHPDDFIETGEFTPPQESLLWLLWREHGDEWLDILLRRPIDSIYASLGRRVMKSTIAVTKRKVHMMIGDDGIFIEEDDYDVLGDILEAVLKGMVVLLDMPGASDAQERLLTVIVTRRIFRKYEVERRINPSRWRRYPTVIIVIEEAHRYFSKAVLMKHGERRDNIFTTISKRGRKYRVGLCCITQMPGELEETIIRQQLTKIVLPLPTKPDYSKVVNYTPYLEGAEEEIKNLERGEALLISPPSGIKFAVPLKIHQFEDLVYEELEEEVLKSKVISQDRRLKSSY